MFSLKYAYLPDTIEVGGRKYRVKTAHYYWFMFDSIVKRIMQGESVSFDEVRFIFYDEDNTPAYSNEVFEKLCDFLYNKGELPREIRGGKMFNAIDYELDAQVIYSAVLQCYGIDLFEREYHWHKVRAMIANVTNTRLNELMDIRGSSPTSKQKELLRMKKAYEIRYADKKAENKKKQFEELLKKE